MSIPSKIKRWYLGGPLPTKERISETAETFRLPNTFEPSVSAQLAQYIVKHFPGFIAAVFAAAVALFIYFDSKAGDAKPNSEKTSSVKPVVVIAHDN
ncbi:MAG: hypothetical protein Q8O64_09960 [Sideroxyarcus sp.]|nr:hypothetical protein [Sideroxyarcus sp.]